MKKIIVNSLALIAFFVTFSSCVSELTLGGDEMYSIAPGHEIHISLSPTSRTNWEGGKTVWTAGDSLWISNGVVAESVVVPEDSWGKQDFSFTPKSIFISPENPSLYAVYPYSAANGIVDGKIQVTVPTIQTGRFADAHIAAAESDDYSLVLYNVAAIMKVTVPEEHPIQSLALIASNSNPLAGTGEVDFGAEDPTIVPLHSTSNITVSTEGTSGDFFIAVIPGTFDAGFKMIAAGTSFEAGVSMRETRSANSVRVNTLMNLGFVGTSFSPIPGEGTESSPWILEDLSHLLAFSRAVNEGNAFAGQYVKLGNDIAGVTEPIGSLNVSYSSSYTISGAPFKGNFDGAGHTITLNISSGTAGRSSRVGLFGGLADGAVVKNLVIDGAVNMDDCNTIGALAGSIYADTEGVTVSNVTNKAAVNGNNQIGGLIGEMSANTANKIVIENCRNEGKVSAGSYGAGGIVGRAINKAVNKAISGCVNTGAVKGQYDVGGIVGYSYYCVIADCENSGAVESTNDGVGAVYSVSSGKFTASYHCGAGGISGWTQISSIARSKNSGEITGPCKIGGVAAATYWTGLTDCENTGTISSTKNVCGGVIGWAATSGTQTRCVNKGEVTGSSYVGGVAGYADAMGTSSGSANLRFNNCENHGKVTAKGESAGGIMGFAKSYNKSGSYNVHAEANGCINAKEAEVYAQYRVGGIMGTFDIYANAAEAYIRNCENHGTIVGTRTDKDGGEVAGGIAGCTLKKPTGSGAGLHITNCLNAGKIQYAVASHVGVYCGGIVGRFLAGSITNVANLGTVGPVSGEPGEGVAARLGSLVGSLENFTANSFLEEGYSVAGVADNYVGTESVAPDTLVEKANNLRVFDAFGVLDSPATVNEKSATVVYQALNYWVEDNQEFTYYQWGWSNGPVFLKN